MEHIAAFLVVVFDFAFALVTVAVVGAVVGDVVGPVVDSVVDAAVGAAVGAVVGVVVDAVVDAAVGAAVGALVGDLDRTCLGAADFDFTFSLERELSSMDCNALKIGSFSVTDKMSVKANANARFRFQPVLTMVPFDLLMVLCTRTID